MYLKPALVEIAHCAVKSTKSPYYKSKYEKLVKRRGKKRAIIAIARMILTAIYNMLSTGEVWNPCDLFKIDIPDELKAKQEEKAVKQAVKFLEKRGIWSQQEDKYYQICSYVDLLKTKRKRCLSFCGKNISFKIFAI